MCIWHFELTFHSRQNSIFYFQLTKAENSIAGQDGRRIFQMRSFFENSASCCSHRNSDTIQEEEVLQKRTSLSGDFLQSETISLTPLRPRSFK